MIDFLDSAIDVYAENYGKRRMTNRKRIEDFQRFLYCILQTQDKYKQYQTPLMVFVQNNNSEILRKISEKVLIFHNRSKDHQGIPGSKASGVGRGRSRRLV